MYSLLQWVIRLSWDWSRYFIQDMDFWWSTFSFRWMWIKKMLITDLNNIQRLLLTIPCTLSEIECGLAFPVLPYKDLCVFKTQAVPKFISMFCKMTLVLLSWVMVLMLIMPSSNKTAWGLIQLVWSWVFQKKHMKTHFLKCTVQVLRGLTTKFANSSR
jgi:hypothetical protein